MGATGPDFQPGDAVPGTKYSVVRQIGAGGMGIVYQVVKPPAIQGVLKLMSSELTDHEEFRTRFLDEVRVLAQIDHPNVVKVFDYDKLPDGTPFYVMELLHGRTVRDVLATMGTIPPRVAFEITRQLCEALHCAHTHDIPVIHRDIKPENIFLHAPRHGEPVVKLIDFGVVAVADRQHDGAFVGTWKYAAPEQIRGERATPATDLYAVGLVLYEMLCGVGPFEHIDSGPLISQAHLVDIPPPVSKFAPWVPPSIVELIAASLAKEPRHRPRDAYVFSERLYELEWASDGKDPNERTSEGPLSRILSTVGGPGKPSSKNMLAASPKDRLGNVPVIGVPQEARHDGPTMRGMGGHTHEPTSPGEDALLAGLGAAPDARSKKARESGPSLDGADKIVIRPGSSGRLPAVEATPRTLRREGAGAEIATLDAPPSAPKLASARASGVSADTDAGSNDATTLKRTRAAAERTFASDTLGAQESDAQRAPHRAGKLAVPIALALCGLIAAISFAAYRSRSPTAGAGGAGAAAAVVAPMTEVTAATAPAATAPAATATATVTETATPAEPVAETAAPAESGETATTAKIPAPVAKIPAPSVRGGKTGSASIRPHTSPSAASPRASAPAATTAATPTKQPPPPPSKDESFLRGL